MVSSTAKRPAPAADHPAKHPRRDRDDSPPLSSIADQSVDGSAYGDAGMGAGMDDEARAKAARKEARTMRNRESAQRSRNQRKQHLVWLEKRVVELEHENKALKSGSSSPPPAPASPAAARASSPSGSVASSGRLRETSPAQSVISLATDLGLPTELVSGGSGVNLSSVAPPPADLDLAPQPLPSSPPPSRAENDDVELLREQNRALRERVGLLEGLVKQVVSLSNLSGLAQPEAPLPEQDWSTLLPNISTAGLDDTPSLSPPLYTSFLPASVFTPISPTFPSLSLPTTTSPKSSSSPLAALPADSDSSEPKSTPGACHSAVVVTLSPSSPLSEGGWGKALQRAWGVAQWDLEMEMLIQDLEGRNAMQEAGLAAPLGAGLGEWREGVLA
ncbi:hypothetical protein IAR50_003702 [Cryptococcus sp. DSM 104548]